MISHPFLIPTAEQLFMTVHPTSPWLHIRS
jgi:hypothetical protein